MRPLPQEKKKKRNQNHFHRSGQKGDFDTEGVSQYWHTIVTEKEKGYRIILIDAENTCDKMQKISLRND